MRRELLAEVNRAPGPAHADDTAKAAEDNNRNGRRVNDRRRANHPGV